MVPYSPQPVSVTVKSYLWDRQRYLFKELCTVSSLKKKANPNKIFVFVFLFVEKHPASITISNAIVGRYTLSEISLQSYCSIT